VRQVKCNQLDYVGHAGGWEVRPAMGKIGQETEEWWSLRMSSGTCRSDRPIRYLGSIWADSSGA
jgi:hypothetical protein